jgi:gas vesicle protein
MSAVPNTTPPGQLPITQEKLQEVIAKSMLSTTSNGCYGQICTLKVPNPNAGRHEVRAWDGVQRGSPAEEYLKKARGGLDPVRGDSWHFQQSASVKDGIVLEIEGHVIGKLIGPVVGAAGALLPIAKEAAKTAFKSASEAAARAGKTASESASIAAKAAGDAAARTLNAAKKAVSDGVAILARRYPKYKPGWSADRVAAMDKGKRPPPSEYLDDRYIREHLREFDGGGSRFMTQSNLDKYGIGQKDGTSFIMPSSEADAIIASSKGDPRALEAALGLPDKALDSAQLVRVDIANPQSAGLRIPSGNEAGANSLWIPGGKLPNGSSEAIIDAPSLLPHQITVTPVRGKAP